MNKHYTVFVQEGWKTRDLTNGLVNMTEAQEVAKANAPADPNNYVVIMGLSGKTAYHYRTINGEVVAFDHRWNHMAYRDELAYVRANAN